ncbi:MAG: UvrD-helicase domain-containing protein [Francisellaceae bacterium]
MQRPLDYNAREQALNPENSYIVQAPAGSGKTETLTQRYLKLLAEVEHPEEIVALTFTRKAAHEMRQRIYMALKQSEHDQSPDSAHKRITWSLAQAALARSKRQGWNILDHPGRMRITTIDAFSQFLASRLPLNGQQMRYGNVTDDANPLYESAVTNLLYQSDEKSPWHDALCHCLLNLDNDLSRLNSLLCTMLSKREQWLALIIQLDLDKPETKAYIEEGFLQITQVMIKKLQQALDISHHRQRLSDILRFVQPSLDSQTSLLSEDTGSLKSWQVLIKLLFTDKQTPRKRFTKKNGLPASDKTAKAHAQWLTDYLASITADNADSLSAMVGEFNAFAVDAIIDSDWQLLKNLCLLLKVCVAFLKLEFSHQQKHDFNEVTLMALDALGDEESPTDLMLYLDHQIRHFLIDEFQDTSILQYHLLQKLIGGWQNGDGRTLFIVGDPMQSIYRFRQADVGLFLSVRDHGIADIKPQFLQLSCNFRSNAAIVKWVNHHFKRIFPTSDEINLGAIRYCHAETMKPDQTEHMIECHLFDDDASEASAIAEYIRHYQHINPAHSIAVLVRARSHLTPLIPTLKAFGIAITESQIDRLFHKPQIQDLTALSFILSNTSDRFHWISLLKSRLFGFGFKELSQLIDQRGNESTDDDFLTHLKNHLGDLDASMHQQKLIHFLDWLKAPAQLVGRISLMLKLDQAWRLLDGDALYPEPSLYEHFIAILDTELNDDHSHLADSHRFLGKLKAAYLSDHELKPVSVMTIHKSKGLEFDCVIIPALHKIGKNNEHELFLHAQYQHEDNRAHHLISPIKHAWSDNASSHYQAIAHMQKIRGHFELQRLFYVATTRAKSSLFLTASPTLDKEGQISISAESLLALIYDQNPAQWQNSNSQTLDKETMINTDDKTPILPMVETILDFHGLKRFDTPASAVSTMEQETLNHPDIEALTPSTERLSGTVLHAAFDYLSRHQDNDHNKLKHHLRNLYHRHAIDVTLQHEIEIMLKQAIDNTMRQFPWILTQDGLSEQDIHALSFNRIQKRTMDRILYYPDRYEIIDYKFSTPAKDESLSQFIERQCELYRAQLVRYRRLVRLATENDKKILTYLYFPLIPHLQPV